MIATQLNPSGGEKEISQVNEVINIPDGLAKIANELRATPFESYAPIGEQLAKLYSENTFKLEDLLPKGIPIFEIKDEPGNTKVDRFHKYIKENSKIDAKCFVYTDPQDKIDGKDTTTIFTVAKYGLISEKIQINNGHVVRYHLIDRRGSLAPKSHQSQIASDIQLSLSFSPVIENRDPNKDVSYELTTANYLIVYGEFLFIDARNQEGDEQNISIRLKTMGQDPLDDGLIREEIGLKKGYRLDRDNPSLLWKICSIIFKRENAYEKSKQATKFFFRD